MSAHERVAFGHKRGDGGHADGPRLLVLRLDPLAIAAVAQRGSQLVGVQAEILRDARENVSRADVLVQDEVRAVDALAEGVAGAVFVRPFRRLVGRRRVVPVAAGAALPAGLIREAREVRASGSALLRRPGQFLALEWNPRVQLERLPFHVDVVVGDELVDPILADITVRSDEVAEDRNFRRHRLTPWPALAVRPRLDRTVGRGRRAPTRPAACW